MFAFLFLLYFFLFIIFYFVLKCLDCLFGLSLFFMVVLCHQEGEDTCREPMEAHARNLLRVPPAGFWSRGGGQESHAQTKVLCGAAWVPQGWLSCHQLHGADATLTVHHHHHGHCCYSTWPDPSSSHPNQMEIPSHNSAKTGWDQGHVFKQRPGDHRDTFSTQLSPLASYVAAI